MTFDLFIKALGARRVGNAWMAKCPAHNDKNPSLAICEKNAKILFHCHAGCDQRTVLKALRARGLWKPERAKPQRRIVAEYNYTDENGRLLYQTVRYEPKDFRQRRPNKDGPGWIWNLHGVRRVLYRLPEIIEAPIVFICEGEKDCETLRSHGFVATTNVCGADARWIDSYTETLAGKECILIPDSDEPGRKRVANIARALLGKAARIIILQPDNAKDITEWFARGHSELELIAAISVQGVAQ